MAYQQFLSGLLSKNHIYQQSDYVERHVGAVLQCNRGLNPEIDVLTLNSGVSSKLLVLRGVVPIEYRGGTYYIPVDIWLPDVYPLLAPIVFVTPTVEMRVKPNHPSVDHSGHASISYLRLWNPTSSTLVELVSMLSVEFSNNPPVYRYNPKNPQPTAITQGQQYISQNEGSSSSLTDHQSDIARAEQLIRDKLIAFVKDHTEYVNGLISHQFEQKNGSDLIEKGLQKLILQKELLQKYKERVRIRILEVEDWCKAHTSADPPSHETLIDTVDQRILPADAWSNQLFDETANDFAIEDTLYVLDKFLQEDRIDLATYLKKVRLLARDQFFARAVCIKVESKQQQALMTNHGPEPL